MYNCEGRVSTFHIGRDDIYHLHGALLRRRKTISSFYKLLSRHHLSKQLPGYIINSIYQKNNKTFFWAYIYIFFFFSIVNRIWNVSTSFDRTSTAKKKKVYSWQISQHSWICVTLFYSFFRSTPIL